MGSALWAARQDVPPTKVTSIRADEFFSPTKVWRARLSMSADAWTAMQPRQSAGASLGSLWPVADSH